MQLADRLSLELMVGHILQFHNCLKNSKKLFKVKNLGN